MIERSNRLRRALGALVITSLTAASLLVPQAARAAFPDKPIRLIVGFPAGGPLDSHARLLTDRLGQILGQQIIVDYKPGAGGTIGAETVAHSPADGYTLLLANTGQMVINPALYRKLPYHTLKDLAPVARTAQQPLALVVNNAVPAQTLPQFIAYAKANPGKLNYASAGNGGISHLVPEMFKQAAGIYLVHLPYRGSAPAFADVLAGHAQFMAESVPQVTQYVQQGKIRALAVTSRERSPALPGVPTLIESGIKDFDVVGFYGILAPAGTPAEVVDKLADAIRQTLETPDVRSRMVQQGADPAFLAAVPFRRFLEGEMPRWERAVKASGAQLD
ncbi:MAG: tripartite tricarboxylate transporter substrate binding protein [Burkholderiaceae bacterium]